jgi:hypothetical protein
MQGVLPQADRTKLTEYFDAIRDASSASRSPRNKATNSCRSSTIRRHSASWEDHLMLMFDLQYWRTVRSDAGDHADGRARA